MSLRVISGTARGRRLKSVPGDSTRPITDQVKEALFNILGADVTLSTWWDVFAGTGAVGIEALSRGANLVRFLDKERLAIETIRENIDRLKFIDRSEILRGDAFFMLGATPDRNFDYVYIAPPQYIELWSRAVLTLDANPGWFNDTSWVIVQINPKEYQALELRNLAEFDERKYGNTLLVFYRSK